MSLGPFGSGSFGTQVFSASPLYTTKKLIDKILQDTNHQNPAVETAKRQVVLNAIINRYAEVTTSQHWDWLYQATDFNFQAPYAVGTILPTQSSSTVSGVGTVWNSNIVPNNVLVPTGRTESYLIETVNSNTTLTLEAEYAGDTPTDPVNYEIIKPIYTLPSDLEHVQSIVLDGYYKMIPLGRQEFRQRQGANPGLTGIPRWFTETGRRAQDGVRLLEIYPAPDKAYIAQLNYGVNIQSLTDEDSSYPLIPDRHRVVLYYGGMADMNLFLRDRTNSDIYEKRFQLALNTMRNDKQLTDSRVILSPSRKYRGRLGRRSRGIVDPDDFARED